MSWGGGDFLHRFPDAGAPASVQTKFKILYDDKNLYIVFKNFDPEPDKIVSRMSRRDGFEGEQVEVNIDSYYDKRTAFSFSLRFLVLREMSTYRTMVATGTSTGILSGICKPALTQRVRSRK